MRRMFKSFIISARPKTLLVGLAPIILGTALAANYKNGKLSPLILTLTVLCTLLMQIGTNIVNEYYDHLDGVDTKDRMGPKRSIQLGHASPNQLKFFYQTCFSLSFFIGLGLVWNSDLIILATGVISILVAYMYTGGPLPLSHYYMGEFLAFLFFGPVAVLGTFYLHTSFFHLDALVLSLIPGFISAALMSLNNLRDIDTDKKTPKRTLPMLLGKNKAKFFTLFLGLAPLIISLFYFLSDPKPWNFITFLPPILFIGLWKRVLTKEGIELNLGIAAFGKYNVLYCILYAVSLLQ